MTARAVNHDWSKPSTGEPDMTDTQPDLNQLVFINQHDELIALAEQLGAVEFNRWVADGMLCRRYISPDGNIDLTVRVP